jgi:hypothetical protein
MFEKNLEMCIETRCLDDAFGVCFLKKARFIAYDV